MARELPVEEREVIEAAAKALYENWMRPSNLGIRTRVPFSGAVAENFRNEARIVANALATREEPTHFEWPERYERGDEQTTACGQTLRAAMHTSYRKEVTCFACLQTMLAREVEELPGERSPGDGQRPLLRWSDRDVRAMLAAGHASSTALSSLMERAQEKGYVRDTEREHEPDDGPEIWVR